MKGQTNPATGFPKQIRKSISFFILTVFHYLFGISGMVASILMATAANDGSQKIKAIISITSIILFALTQPDFKFRRLENTRHYFGEKQNYNEASGITNN